MLKSGIVVDFEAVAVFPSLAFLFLVACVAGSSCSFSVRESWKSSESAMLGGCSSQRGSGSGGSARMQGFTKKSKLYDIPMVNQHLEVAKCGN